MFLTLLACSGTAVDSGAPIVQCAEGELADEGSCVPARCGTGTWGSLDGTLFVDGAASSDGDGSRQAPYTTVGEALSASGEGAVIALAAGTYTETLDLGPDHDGLQLLGRCQDLVLLDGSEAPDGTPTIGLNLSRTGEPASVTLEGLTIQGGRQRGIDAWDGGLTLRNATVRENHRQNLLLDGGVQALLEHVEILDGLPDLDEGLRGQGLFLGLGSTLEGRRLLLARNHALGIAIVDPGTSAVLEHVEIRDTRAHDHDPLPLGGGVNVEYGASLVATDLAIHQTVTQAVGVFYDGATAEIAGLVIDGVEPRYLLDLELTLGQGLAAEDATVVLSDVTVTDLAGNAITALADAVVTVTGLEVSQLRSEMPDRIAAGLYAEQGGRVVASEVWMHDVLSGVRTQTGGSVEVEDLLLEGLLGGLLSVGLSATEDSEIVGRKVEIHGAHTAGVLAAYGSRVALQDALVADTRATTSGGMETGIGAAAVYEGWLELEHTTIDGAVYGGVMVADSAVPSVLVDVEILNVRASATSRVASAAFAQQATLEAEGLVVRGVEGPGLVSAGYQDTPTTLRCESCEVSEATFASALVLGDAGLATLELVDSQLGAAGVDASLGGGVGVFAAFDTGEPSLLVDGCTFEESPYASVWVVGPGRYVIRDSALVGGLGSDIGGGLIAHGNAVYASDGTTAWGGASGLWLDGNVFTSGDAETVLLHGGTATLTDNTWDQGAEIRQQGCDATEPLVGVDDAPTWTDCPDTNVVVVSFETDPLELPPLEDLF